MTKYLTYFVDKAKFELPYRIRSDGSPYTLDVTFFVKAMKIDGWRRNHLKGLNSRRLDRDYGQYTRFSFAAQTNFEDILAAEDLRKIRVKGQELVQKLVSDGLIDVQTIKTSDSARRRRRYEILHK